MLRNDFRDADLLRSTLLHITWTSMKRGMMAGNDLVVIPTASFQRILCFRAESDLFAEVEGEDYSQLYCVVQLGRFHFSKALGG